MKVLIIGDVMVDSYYSGKVERISPEAPVPVVSVRSEENRLGGAANVARNIVAMEAIPYLCSVIGEDAQSNVLIDLCEQEGILTDGMMRDKNRVTTVKTRIIGNNHQLLRVDSEKIEDLSNESTVAFAKRIEEILDKEKIEVIIFEDYDKGVITEDLIEAVVKMADKRGIPTTADPKKKNFLNYRNITLFKPNLKELKEGLNMEFENAKDEGFHQAIEKLQSMLNAKNIFITLSEDGVYIKSGDEEFQIPAHLRNISDVSGAGDTVISVASLCLAKDQNASYDRLFIKSGRWIGL